MKKEEVKLDVETIKQLQDKKDKAVKQGKIVKK